jgi:GNAT superfamily N-acetyltransferase
MSNSAGTITYHAATTADFDELAGLRIAAMQESLERVGRFDPERARERLRKSFYPDDTEFILVDGRRIGFYTFRSANDGFRLDHLYIHPDWQGRGVGSGVLHDLLSKADARGMPVSVGALRDSASNRFYQRHGFVQTGEDEWDIYYVRTPPLERRETPDEA